MNSHCFTFNPFAENCYVIWADGEEECIIVDPGCYDEAEWLQLDSFLSANKLRPTLLLNTHCHIDHVFGNHFVCSTYGLKPLFHASELPIFNSCSAVALAYGLEYNDAPGAEKFIEDHQIIRHASLELQCLLCPGHSPGSICFYVENAGILIGGDVLFYESIGRTDLPGGNHQDLISSIRSLIKLLPVNTRVFPGHGPATTIGHESKYNPFF